MPLYPSKVLRARERVATLVLEEWEDDTHIPKNGDLGVHRDSQNFRVQFQGSKHLALKRCLYHWKSIKV
jgi:hypothetical protein